MCDGVILHVTYTERGEHIRLISARRAVKHEQEDYYGKIRSDARLSKYWPTHRAVVPGYAMRPMTEAEIEAARSPILTRGPCSRRTPDGARVPASGRCAGARADAGRIRRRYHIPLAPARLEQGRTEPDQPARAYLKAIAGDPVAVQRALEVGHP